MIVKDKKRIQISIPRTMEWELKEMAAKAKMNLSDYLVDCAIKCGKNITFRITRGE